MRHAFERAEITLYITTEQIVSNFTIETKFSGLIGFNETSPDSGLYSRTGTARRGEYTVIKLQDGRDSNGQPVLSVLSDGNNDESDRQKGLILTADNPKHELTVYALSSDDGMTSADAFMAINCVEFPTAIDYQYFVFSSYTSLNDLFGMSQFLITPCQDNTLINVRPSQQHAHPSWVNPFQSENPVFTGTTFYQRPFNRFDTLMISNANDLTGTIITSDKPLSVFSGGRGISNMIYLVEQVPPHPTYGNRFLLAPFDLQPRELPNYLTINIDIYRIGSVSDEVSIQVDCQCEPIFLMNNAVPLLGSGSSFTAIINRGQFVECPVPVNNRTFCSIQSKRPVTVMSYHYGLLQNRLIFDFLLFSWLMVYTPPTDSYLTQYSLPSLPNDLSLSYFQKSDDVLITPGLLVNGNASIVSDFTLINCSQPCSGLVVCGRGATRLIGQNESILVEFSGNTPFWGYAYGFSTSLSIAYPLPFEMRPIGCKFYTECMLIYFTYFLQWPGSKLKTLLFWKMWVMRKWSS